jgi:hypothetical protein
MKTIGDIVFPTTPEELKLWTPTIRIVALCRDVLVVATTRIEGTWKAYCAAVPGQNHDNEWQEVLRQGSPLIKEIACVIFKDFAAIPYSK